MEPLSVAASIVGILSAAAKVVEIVQPFITSMKDAPKLALTVYSEVNRVLVILNSLKLFLESIYATSSSRGSLVEIDHLRVLFTDGVLLFSDLETLLAPLEPLANGRIQAHQRLLWLTKKAAIDALMLRVEHFLTALSALLNIFQCQSDLAASHSQQDLANQISILLDNNRSLHARIANLENAFHGSLQSDFLSPQRYSAVSALDGDSVFQFSDALDSSRVYKRVRRIQSRESFSTTVQGSKSWSILSGLSLADISAISVIALPLYATDIEHAEHYVFSEPNTTRARAILVNEHPVKQLARRIILRERKGFAIRRGGVEFGPLVLFGSFMINTESPDSEREVETEYKLFLYHRFLLICDRATLFPFQLILSDVLSLRHQDIPLPLHVSKEMHQIIDLHSAKTISDHRGFWLSLCYKSKGQVENLTIKFPRETLRDEWAEAIERV